MKEKTQTRTWEITLLTPLHVGDGENLISGMDYIAEKGRLSVIHLDTVLKSIADNPKAISDLTRMNLAEFIRSYNLTVRPDYTLPIKGGSPREVRRFLKNAYGEPYIAGSTIKGAIRTALWTTLDRSDLSSVQNYRQFESTVSRLDGEPHNDFLRPLTISDSIGIKPEGTLAVEEIKFFNVQNGNKAGWKDFSSKKTLVSFEDAAGVSVEALQPKARFYIQAGLSQFLRTGAASSLWRIPKATGLADFTALAAAINDHSRKLASLEKTFFAYYGTAVSEVSAFYDELIYKAFDEIRELPEAFIIRMAWGCGWNGMTGDWLSKDSLDTVRKENNLGKNFCPQCKKEIYTKPKRGKYFCKSCKIEFPCSNLILNPIFPKSRRLAMKNGYPTLPLGWAFVKPVRNEMFTLHVSLSVDSPPQTKTNGLKEEENTNRNDEPKEKKETSEKALADMLLQFQTNVEGCNNLPGEIGSFIQRIESQKLESVKKAMCQILLKKGESLDKKKKFSKALAGEKKWAQDLATLCKTCGLELDK